MRNPIPSIVLFGALALSSSAVMSAQNVNRPAAREAPIARRLALTHDQQIQFRAINRDRKQQVNEVKADPSLSPRMKHEKIKDIHAAAETKIRSILNQNQLDEYDQFKRERQQKAADARDMATPQ